MYSGTIFVYYLSLLLSRREAVTEIDSDMSETVKCDSKLARIKFDDTNMQFFSVSVPNERVFISKQNLSRIRGFNILQLPFGVEMERSPCLSAKSATSVNSLP